MLRLPRLRDPAAATTSTMIAAIVLRRPLTRRLKVPTTTATTTRAQVTSTPAPEKWTREAASSAVEVVVFETYTADRLPYRRPVPATSAMHTTGTFTTEAARTPTHRFPQGTIAMEVLRHLHRRQRLWRPEQLKPLLRRTPAITVTSILQWSGNAPSASH